MSKPCSNIVLDQLESADWTIMLAAGSKYLHTRKPKVAVLHTLV